MTEDTTPTPDRRSAVVAPFERPVRPRAWTLQSELDAGDSTCGAHLWFTDPVNSSWAPLYDRDAIDRLNSERMDLALLVGRLIRRMRAARAGGGIAAGDDALEQQAIGYLRRKGLASPLRDEGPNLLLEDNQT